MVRSIALFVASLAVGTSLPFAADQSMKAMLQSDEGLVNGVRMNVQLHKAYLSQDRYDYYRALDMYNVRLQNGEKGLKKPDINDPESMRFYLSAGTAETVRGEPIRTEPLSTTDYVKKADDVVSPDALPVRERKALAQAERTGKCFKYPGFSKQFDIECQKRKGKKEIRTTGIQSDLQNAKIDARARLRGAATSDKPTAPLTIKGYDYKTIKPAVPRNVRSGSSSSAQ